jgi:nucleotide-binding universal stress UspA family protein
MYRHILIPTDGSELAERGVAHGLALAKSLGAKVSLIYVVEPLLAVTGDFASVLIARKMRPRRLVFPARQFKWRTCHPIKPSSQRPRTKAAISLLCHGMGVADFPRF